MTFGQRLKHYRKEANLTQMELAEAIGVSMQAVSKWETDAGMPDISQIVPLSRELAVSTDVLFGVIGEHSEEFEAVKKKCREIEAYPISCNWPAKPENAKKAYDLMYEYYSAHPNDARAATFLLESAECYWGKIEIAPDTDAAVKECERFANCIFRHSDKEDMVINARYNIASVYAFTGQKEKVREVIEEMPFLLDDNRYWAAEILVKAGDYEEAEKLCRESFTQKARFVSRCLRLMAQMPTCSLEEKVEYNEYMLRIINAFLTGGDYMPHRQIYQKMALVTGLIKENLWLGKTERALEHFADVIATAEKYLAFLENGSKGESLMLLDDGLDRGIENPDDITRRREMVLECLRRAVYYSDHMKEAAGNAQIAEYAEKAKAIRRRYGIE